MAVLAYSTHVKGLGHFNVATGREYPRITVSLAAGTEKTECEAINLGYRDPALIEIAEWKSREEQGILLVENADEILYRVE